MHEQPARPAPTMPSVDNVQLAGLLRTAEWTIDDVASDLPADRATPEQLRDLAIMLELISKILRQKAGYIVDEG